MKLKEKDIKKYKVILGNKILHKINLKEEKRI